MQAAWQAVRRCLEHRSAAHDAAEGDRERELLRDADDEREWQELEYEWSDDALGD